MEYNGNRLHGKSISQKRTNSAMDLVQVHWLYFFHLDSKWKGTWWLFGETKQFSS